MELRWYSCRLSAPSLSQNFWVEDNTVGEWNFGSAISMIMAIIMMLMMMAVRKVEDRNQGGKRR